MARGRAIGTEKRRNFLERLRECGEVRKSALSSGLSIGTVYRLRHQDAAFARSWDAALEIGLDRLEEEALRRALEGVEQTVFYRGRAVASVKKPSDKLLMFLLRAHRPERYGDKVDVGVSDEFKRLLAAVDSASHLTVDSDATAEDDDNH